MKKNQGMTLIELVTVMLIIAVLTMIAGPALGVFFANQKLITFSSDMARTVSLVRNQARTTGAPIIMQWQSRAGNNQNIIGWSYDFDPVVVRANSAGSETVKITTDQHINFIGQALNGYFIQQCNGATPLSAEAASLRFNVNGTIQMVDTSGGFLVGPASIKFSSTSTPTVRTLTLTPSGNVDLVVTSNQDYKDATRQPVCP